MQFYCFIPLSIAGVTLAAKSVSTITLVGIVESILSAAYTH